MKKHMSEFWPLAYQECHKEYPNLFKLVELLLCLPFSNAIVQRGFSTVRRILTDWRGCLAEETIKDLLLVATWKVKFETRAERERLIEKVASTFIDGDGHSEKGLSRRRINKALGDKREPFLKKMKVDRNDSYFANLDSYDDE